MSGLWIAGLRVLLSYKILFKLNLSTTMYFRSYVTLFAIALVSVGDAANCRPDLDLACVANGGALGKAASMWDARGDYCGLNKWKYAYCEAKNFKGYQVTINDSNPGANNQQTCWDALENIISRTSVIPIGNYSRESQANSYRASECQGRAGEYNYNGVKYVMSSCSNSNNC